MKLKSIPGLLFAFVLHSIQLSAQPYFDVMKFGAVADGTTITTSAIQKTIDVCAKKGGGKIFFPPGRYLTGPLFLKSQITVEIGPGAVLLFNPSIANTPVVDGSWEGIDRKVYASLFTGFNLQNISIIGAGTLDGQGKVWWDAYRQTAALRTKMKILEREPENPPGSAIKYPRPRMINLYHCNQINITGITIINSPSWTIHPIYRVYRV